jgi:hypothetical protein
MYGYDRISQIIQDPNLRASDADREATADRLRQHHIEGRLDQDEFQARLDSCFAAKTVGELAELTRDLPAGPARRDSGTRTNFGLLGSLRMIPIVPIILAIVADRTRGLPDVGAWAAGDPRLERRNPRRRPSSC